jgi:hypothetical protein
MPNPDAFYSDDRETYDQVIEPMVDKIAKVCNAFKMPFIIVVQPRTSEDMDETRGQMHIPKHTATNIGLAGYILNANDEGDLKRRIMKLATHIAMSEMKKEGNEQMRDLFSSLKTPDPEDKPDKPLN